MKIRKQSSKNHIIDVSQGFAKILRTRYTQDDSISNFSYEFTWTVDIVAAVREDVNSVKLSFRRELPHKSITPWQSADNFALQITPDDILDGITMISSKNKDQKIQNGVAVLKQTIAPITTKLQPNIKQQIKLALDDADAEKYLNVQKILSTKSVNAINKTSINVPILKTATTAGSTGGAISQQQPAGYNGGNLQSAALKLILQNGIDPSNIVGTGVNVTSTQKSHAGTNVIIDDVILKTSPKFTQIDPKKLSPYISIFSKQNAPTSNVNVELDVEIPTITMAAQRYITIDKIMTLSSDDVKGLENFYIRFELLDKNQNIVGVIDRIVKHKQLLDRFQTPINPPIVKAVSVQRPGKNVIEVQPYDEKTVAVKMYRRSITRINDINNQTDMTYIYAGMVSLNRNSPIKIVDIINNTSPMLYRFVPIGRSGHVGASFSSIVVLGTNNKLKRRRRNVHAAIDVVTDGEFANIRVTNVTKGAIAVGIQRKNKTTHDSSFEYITEKPIVLTDNIETLSYVDNQVKYDNVYEYRLILFFEDGSEEASTAYFMYEHEKQDRVGVEIITSEPEIKKIASTKKSLMAANVEYDVQFSIKSQVDQSDFDQLKISLAKKGLTSLFETELLAGRDALSELIAHKVQRINTSTGEVDDFGVVTKAIFSDVAAGSTHAVKSLAQGTTYRYIITTLLRTPETLFENYEKTVESKQKFIKTGPDAISGLTNKQYKFKPSKFLHPLVLKKGMLTSKESRFSQHSKNEYLYGIIGNTKLIDVTIPKTDANIVRVYSERVDKSTNVLRWDVVGDTSLIDYFIVSLNHIGTEQVVGKVHAFNDTATFEFMHELTGIDMGTATYTVTTMLTNFLKGSAQETGRFVI